VKVDGQFAMTRDYTDRALKFIHDHRDQPFFLYLPHNAVHFPLYPSDKFRGKSPNGLLGDWAEEVDWSVGQVLDALRELGLAEKTLVLFTSDNGGSVQHGSNNTPLRGSKSQTLEGGIRVPTLAWWPGKIPAGTSSDAITSMMDVLPTFARLADAKVPTDRKIDGVDLWPVLAGDSDAKPPRDHFFYFRGLELEAVRSGPWKLHLARDKQAPQLYHLGNDIGESKNVATEHPEEVRRLQEFAATMKDDLGLKDKGPGCRPPGQAKNPRPLMSPDGTVRPDAAGEVKRFP
jgi:arylsulfatase A-like enzyme